MIDSLLASGAMTAPVAAIFGAAGKAVDSPPASAVAHKYYSSSVTIESVTRLSLEDVHVNDLEGYRAPPPLAPLLLPCPDEDQNPEALNKDNLKKSLGESSGAAIPSPDNRAKQRTNDPGSGEGISSAATAIGAAENRAAAAAAHAAAFGSASRSGLQPTLSGAAPPSTGPVTDRHPEGGWGYHL